MKNKSQKIHIVLMSLSLIFTFLVFWFYFDRFYYLKLRLWVVWIPFVCASLIFFSAIHLLFGHERYRKAVIFGYLAIVAYLMVALIQDLNFFGFKALNIVVDFFWVIIPLLLGFAVWINGPKKQVTSTK